MGVQETQMGIGPAAAAAADVAAAAAREPPCQLDQCAAANAEHSTADAPERAAAAGCQAAPAGSYPTAPAMAAGCLLAAASAPHGQNIPEAAAHGHIHTPDHSTNIIEQLPLAM